ncbi:APC family permease [Halorubrum sp. DTA98]|uniref:APC family permease n=1 Tax=Halorubrum sp. DTA98 TaxID=3402163 RepID=UPI003AAB732D
MAPDVQPETQLERTLGFTEALMIGVGTMIGAGIFVLPGPAAGAAGPAIALSFVIGGGIALLTALSASELATAMPRAGGSYHFINEGLGPLFGSIAGFGNWLGLAFASAFYVIGFGSYLGLLLAAVVPLPSLALGPLTLEFAQIGGLIGGVLFIGINYVSTEETGNLQNLIVLGLLGILAVFALLGVVAADLSTLTPFTPEGTGAILPGTALVFVSYLGFVKITTVAGEIKEPSRNLPRALIGSVLIVTVMYAVIMVIVLGVVDRGDIAESETAVADVAGLLFGQFFGAAAVGVGLLTLAGLLATASSANASILAASRINYAMGRDGLVSPTLNKIHDRFKTPTRAIVLTGAFILLFVLIGDVAVLAKAASVLHLVVYGLVNIALIVFREADGVAYDPPYRVPLYPWVPIAGAITSFGLIGFMDPIEILLGLAFVVLSIAWYVVYVRYRTTDDSALATLRGVRTGDEVEMTLDGPDVRPTERANDRAGDDDSTGPGR